jgi:hypothetical protein
MTLRPIMIPYTYKTFMSKLDTKNKKRKEKIFKGKKKVDE